MRRVFRHRWQRTIRPQANLQESDADDLFGDSAASKNGVTPVDIFKTFFASHTVEIPSQAGINVFQYLMRSHLLRGFRNGYFSVAYCVVPGWSKCGMLAQ
jgi:hypothetical protein